MVDVLWYPVAIVAGAGSIYVSLFLHEFAHAIPILLAGGRVSITVGGDEGRTVRLGPLTITLGIDGLWKTLQFGYIDSDDAHSTPIRAVSTLAGPLVTVVIVSLLGMALLQYGDDGPLPLLLRIVFVSELSRAVYTIVPMTYSHGPYAGWESDGKRFLDIVRS